MQLTRRNLIKLGALTGAAGTLPKTVQNMLPAPFHTEVELPPAIGEEKWVPSVCLDCPAGCGRLVRVIAGRAVGIKGDPKHPINQGALCPKGLAGLQELYHPDRVRQPLERVGSRGQGQWKPISWDVALERLAHELQNIRANDPASLGILLGAAPGGMRALWRRFAEAFDTPHFYEIAPPQGELPDDAAALMMGARDGIRVDLSRAEFVLSFCDWLQSFASPVEASRAHALLRRGQADRRVRIVSAEPRLSVTAAKADEWIPVYPGAEGVLALTLAHVLLRDNLNDPFVREHAEGLAEFQSLVMEHYAPDRTAAITGVAVEVVERLAKEFAAHQGAVALGDRSDLRTQMGVLALNALAGSIGDAGAIGLRASAGAPACMCSPPPASSAGKDHPDAAKNGASPTGPSSTLHPDQISWKALLISQANPLFVQPNRWRAVLEKAPFIASFTSFLDDTAQYADLILPDHTPLEAWGGVLTQTLGGNPVLSIGKPVLKPLYDTRPAGDVLLDLAHRIGGPIEAALPWTGYEDVLRETAKPIYKGGSGDLLRKVELESESWTTTKSKPTFDEWFDKLCAAGGWTDTSDKSQSTPASGAGESCPCGCGAKTSGECASPSPAAGKFDFRADVLRRLDAPQVASSPDYPLRLCVFTPLVFAGGAGAHLPYLQGIAGAHLNERRWVTWAAVNPRTAQAQGIADGDWVAIESPQGRIRARARFFEGAMPDVINIPFGLGHTAYGRWAAGAGANPAELLANDATTGEPLWKQTRVRISKAGE